MSFVLELPEFVRSQHKPYASVIGKCWIFLLELRADLPSPISQPLFIVGLLGFR